MEPWLYYIIDDISFRPCLSPQGYLIQSDKYVYCIFYEVSSTIDVTRTETINLVVMLRYSS